MRKRRLTDWLASYLEYASNTESPESYHTWVGMSVIAGALQRKVLMRWGYSEIFPNQYIVLIGPSGRARKGEAISLGRNLLRAINIPLISEAITRQALIRRMKNSLSNYSLSPGTITFQCAVTCISEELSVFLGEGDIKFLADLTNWYDSRDKWTYETKHGGTDEIVGVCFNLLGAMAEDWIPLTIPPGAIGGGFTSRIIFVVESNKGKTIVDPNQFPINKKLQDDLTYDLEQINTLTGEYSFTPDALQAYSTWYAYDEELTRKGHPVISDSRFSGYVARRATHVKKMCMVISASRSNDMWITLEDFQKSKSLLESVEIRMAEVFGRVGLGKYTDQTQSVMEFIQARGSATRQELLRHFYRDIDMPTLEIVEQTLQGMGVVSIAHNPMVGTVTYKWIKADLAPLRLV